MIKCYLKNHIAKSSEQKALLVINVSSLTKSEIEQCRHLTALDILKHRGLLSLCVYNQFPKQQCPTCSCQTEPLFPQTKGQPGGNGTVVHGKRRHKREWVKFARPCREEEDNSKRNPIAQVSHRSSESFQNKWVRCKLK